VELDPEHRHGGGAAARVASNAPRAGGARVLVRRELVFLTMIAELIIAKQRNGPTGKVKVRFSASCTRFDPLEPGAYPETPEDE
jgi:replicative DNA helicase